MPSFFDAKSDDERLPPGQRRVEKWPVLDLGQRPSIAPDEWRLAVDGLVARDLTLDWAAFQALPQVEVAADIHCVTSWSLLGSRWSGVSGAALAAEAGVRPEARFVLFKSHDGYTTNVPLARFLEPRSLLASARDGQPVAAEHGGPVRMVIPSLYFWKSAKWVRRITFSASDQPGYWEIRGYHNDADPWKEERYG